MAENYEMCSTKVDEKPNKLMPSDSSPDSMDDQNYDSKINTFKPSIVSTIDENLNQPLKPSIFRVFLFSIMACWSAINFGYSIGYTTFSIEFLKNTTIINDSTTPLYASILFVGALFGGLLAGFFTMDKFGRKNTMIIAALVSLFGWVLNFPAATTPPITNVKLADLLICSRFIIGLGVGLASTASPVYAIEISTAETFKYTGGFHQIGIGLGFVFCYVTCHICDIFDRTQSKITYSNSRIYIPLVITISVFFQLILAVMLPYVPTWLASKSNKSEKSLHKIKKNNKKLYGIYSCDESLLQILNSDQVTSKFDFDEVFSKKSMYAFFVSVFAFVFQQMVGINPIALNAVSILKSAGISDETLGLMIAGFGQLLGAGLSSATNLYFRRKLVLFISSIVMAFSLLFLGLHQNFWLNNRSIAYIAVLLLFIYYIFFNISWGPIPFILNGLVFTQKSSGALSGIGVMVTWLMTFILSYSYFSMLSAMTLPGVFYFYTCGCLMAALFTYLFVPVTSFRDIRSIPDDFKNNLLHPNFK